MDIVARPDRLGTANHWNGVKMIANANASGVKSVPRIVGRALDGLCEGYKHGLFVPVLEADITGYLYYVLVKQQCGESSNIHISARIPNEEGKRKYPDLVIGEIWPSEEQARAYERWVQSDNTKMSVPKDEALRIVRSKSFKERLRPLTATINTAIEIKPFLKGFSSQQLAVRFGKARKDLEALAGRVSGEKRMLLVFDEVDYLGRPLAKPRLGRLLELRDSLDRTVLVAYVGCDANRGCAWNII